MRQTAFALTKSVLVRAGVDLGSAENARFTKLAGASCVLYAVSSLLGIVVNILLARMLGAAGLGAYAAAFAAVTFLLVLTNTGVPSVVLRYIPIYLKRGDGRLARMCATWGYLHVSVGAVVGASVVVLAVTLGDWLEPSARSTYLAAALVLPLWGIVTLQSSVLQGHERAIQARAPDLIVRPAVLIVLLLGWWLLIKTDTRAPHVAMLMQAAAFLATILVGAWLLRRLGRGTKPAIWLKRAEIRSWYGMAAALTTTQIAEAALAQSALLILPFFVDLDELGLFRAALAASALVSLPATAVMMALPPMIARLFASGERAQLQSLTTNVARLSMLVCLPIGAALYIFGQTILALLFGSEFGHAYPLLLILALGQSAAVIASSAGWILRMTGHERDEARLVVIAAGCQVAALATLAPLHGVIGAAVAQAGGMILLSALRIRTVMRCVRLDPTLLGTNSSPFTKSADSDSLHP